MTDFAPPQGPFWSEKKKFPNPAEYDPENECHWKFMVSTTNIIGVMLGLHPPKNEDDSKYLAEYRTKAWINSVVMQLKVEHAQTALEAVARNSFS